MVVNFRKSDGQLVSLEAVEVKGNKNIVIPADTEVWKTDEGYFQCMKVLRTKINVVINSSKKLGELNLAVNHEDQKIANIKLDNADYGDKLGCRIGVETPDAYKFEVGDEIKNGEIIARSDDYQYYYIKRIGETKNYGEVVKTTEYVCLHWHNIFKKSSADKFKVKSNNVRYYNGSVSNLYCKLFYFGLDLNPEYQRGSVWTEAQKVSLIDSIFRHVPTGAIVIASKKWAEGNKVIGDLEEVVDGKQRILAILDFIYGKFKYNGLYYHEMDECDRLMFDNAPMMYGELRFRADVYNRKEILETFIALNVGGTKVENDVIENAKKMLSEEV